MEKNKYVLSAIVVAYILFYYIESLKYYTCRLTMTGMNGELKMDLFID